MAAMCTGVNNAYFVNSMVVRVKDDSVFKRPGIVGV